MAKFEIKDGVGIIPEGTTTIPQNAFANLQELTSLVIPQTVVEICENAFGDYDNAIGAEQLSSIRVEEGNTKYDSRHNCNAIIETETNSLIAGCKNTIIPDSVSKISSAAFVGCTGLTNIIIPESVTNIMDGAFMGCKNLTSLTIPESVKMICDCAFNGCSGLTSIVIPKYVTEIGFEAFGQCTALTNIYVAEVNTKYDSRNKSNAIIETGANRLIAGCKNTIIPDSVTKIDEGAFSGCTGLTNITIPESVTEIGELAFVGCTGLTSVTIPNSLTKIGDDIFLDCDSLSEIHVPKGKADFFKNLLPEELHALIMEQTEA